jgi:DNA-binding NtrC family response regulator
MARILVVDDDEDVLESLEASLDDAGHTVVAASTAALALAASPQQFDVLLVDLWMRPGPTGLDLKHTLDGKQITVPVILMSSDDEVGAHASRSGCFEYLHKPFSPDQLHAAVARAMADSPAVSSSQASLVSFSGDGAADGDGDGDDDQK